MFKKISSKQLILVNDNYQIYYCHGSLYCKAKEKESLLIKIPNSKFLNLCSHFSILERILRIKPRCAQWIDEKTFIFAQKGFIYRVDISKKTVTTEHRFIEGMTAPLNFCIVSGLKGFDDGILYGTYKNSYDTASIWQRSNNGIWKIVYSFPEKSVLHIHNIIADYSKSRLLVLTGDSDEESGIWEFKNNFSDIKLLVGGSQQYRSCVAFTEKNKIVFATDTPLEENFLYEYDENTQKVKKISSLPGPVIYSATTDKKSMFATSVEPDSMLKGIKYLLTSKLAKGVKDKFTHLFIGDCVNGFVDIAQFEKDILPMGLCQFGNIYFPSGDIKNYYISPQSVKKYSGTLEVFD